MAATRTRSVGKRMSYAALMPKRCLIGLSLLLGITTCNCFCVGSSGATPYLSSTAIAATPVDTSANSESMTREEGYTDPSTVVDRSTLTLLEHVNLNVPSHEHILPFYFDLLGCGMDPRKAANLKPDAPKRTLWANCGASQFHLPFGETPQQIPGMIGLRYDSLDGLKARIDGAGDHIKEVAMGNDEWSGEFVKLVDMYDNVFLCRKGGNPVSEDTWKQPFISRAETETWADVATRYGRDSTECRGIDFVEFACPIGTAEKIALFYESVLDATTSVVEKDDTKIAIIAFGNILASGKADQSLLFRETSDPIPEYDGHHVAMYVGESSADFETAFKNAETAGVVWVNPRFSDKARSLQGAKKWKQFRFKDIVDMKTGKKVFELEHEMRSIDHEAWPGRATRAN